MNVIFSDRAYSALLAETKEKIRTETGGVFLGFYESETWYIVESIDPGPHSIFEVAYFEYDQKYITHLINKIARLYKRNLSLLGLWHRHPGSFDVFSSTDDGTNTAYAKLAPQGAISALVNIDPTFRLTVYHVTVPNKTRYQAVPYQVGDQFFPKNALALWSAAELLEQINRNYNDEYTQSLQIKISPKNTLSEIMAVICQSTEEFDGMPYKEEMDTAMDKDETIELLTGVIFDDLEFFSDQCELSVRLKKAGHRLCLFDGLEENEETHVYFSYIDSLKKTVFIFKNKCYNYESRLFSTLLQSKADPEKSRSVWGTIKEFFKKSRN